jgi:four helix bundle protein
MKINDYKDLIVWRKAMDLAAEVRLLSKAFPRDELYGLTSQLRRAAVSVPSNIAEGQARQSTAGFLNFLSIAQGSLAEVDTQLLLAQRFQYLSDETTSKAASLIIEVAKMLFSLRAKLTAISSHSPLATNHSF